MKKLIPLEEDEQATFCQWLDIIGVTYVAVGNENVWSGIIRALVKNKAMANRIISSIERKMKKLGKKKGFVDMILFFDGGISVYIEMKRRKGGTLSHEQKDWQQRLKLLGFEAHVCKGAEEAIAVAEKYLPEGKRNISANQGKLF